MTPGSKHTTSVITGLSLVLERFPDETGGLNRLFWKNASFRSLCEDYGDCLAALKKWEQSTSRGATAMRQAYVELLGELEQEVRQYLEQEKDALISTGEAGGTGKLEGQR